MKLICTVTGMALLALGLAPAAWADMPPSGEAAQLGTPIEQSEESIEAGSGNFDTLENRINQSLSTQDEAEEAPLPLLEGVELPEGVIIRDSSLGGVTVGTEL